MWMLFATTLNVSLRWLQPRLGLAALLGMIAGPLAYYAGARLGGVSFSAPAAALCAVAAVWTLVLPMLLIIASRCRGPAGTVRAGCAPDRSATAGKPE